MRAVAQRTSALLALGLAGSWLGVGAQVDISVSHQYFVPVRVAVEDPKLLRSAIVQMCALDWATYRRDPSLLPMFHDLTKHSGCGDLRDSSKTFQTTFGELEDEYLRRGCAESGRYNERAPGCVPAGLVFHESRCGSTLSANMLAALPYSVVYSESSPPVDVAWAAGLSQADQVRALRVVLAAMGRPIAAAAYNGVLPPGTAEQGWSPRHLYLKMQSSLVPFMHLFRRAFPETPWVFIHREPVEVLASLLRNALQLPAADAGEGVHVSHTDRGVREAPCMRHRGPGAPAFIRAATGAQDDVEAIMAVPPEEYCAAAVAELCATALHEASSARLSALRELGVRPPADLPLANGAGLAALLAADPRVTLLDGMLLNRTDGTGTVGGVGQAVFVEYTRMPHALLPILQRHFAPRQVRVLHPFPSGPVASSEAAAGSSGAEGSGAGGAEGASGVGETSPASQRLGALDAPAAPDVDDVDATLRLHRQQQGGVPQGYMVVRDVLSDADVAGVLAVAGKYSKARGRTGKADIGSGGDGGSGAKGAKVAAKEASKHLTRGPSLDKEGHFVADSEDKQGRSWPALKVAAGKYLRSLRGFMLAFNIENGPSDGAVGGSDAEGEAGAKGGARRRWNSGFNVTFAQADAEGRAAAGAAGAATAAPAAHRLPASGAPYLPAADARMLPIGGGYPWHYPLQDILTLWNADVTTLPASHGAFQSLRTFDFDDPAELAEAELYRSAEVPFVIRNVPSMADTVAKWASDEHLVSVMGAETVFMADVNDDNHFMYYHKAAARLDKGYKPPTEEARVKAPDWLERAHEVATAVAAEEAGQLPEGWAAPAAVQALGGVSGGLNAHANNGDDAALAANGGKPLKALPPMSPALGTGFDVGAPPASGAGSPSSSTAGASVGAGDSPFPAAYPQPPQRPQRELWYMRASTNPRMAQENKFIHDAFPVFDATKGKSFFVVDPKQQRGIHCRFGMPGIIAEDHYDSGRNFVFMVRGRKRYVLSRPSECGNLAMLRDGPSARHSAADWTSPEGIAALRNASGIEVVMEAGDALYIPAFWFHFIESLTLNIQCNARSGTPPMGAEAIADCGFDARYTEHAGVDTDATPPAHHLAAVANIGAAGLGGRAVLPGRELLGLAAALASAGSEGGEPVFGPSQLEKEAAAREAAAAAGNDTPAGVLASALSNMQQAISSTVSSALGLGSAGAGSGGAQQQQQSQDKVGNSGGMPGGAVSAGLVVPAKHDPASQPPPGLSAEEAAKHQQQAAEQAAAAAAAQRTAAQHAAAAGTMQQPSTSAGLEGGSAAAPGGLSVLGLRPVDHTGKPIGPNAFENAMTKAARAGKQQGSGGSTLDTRHNSQVLDTVLLLLALGGCATLVISVRRRWWVARSVPCLPTSAASATGGGPKRPDGTSRPSLALATGVIADGQRSRSGSGNGVALAVNGGSGALFHRGAGALGGGSGNASGAVAVKMDRSD